MATSEIMLEETPYLNLTTRGRKTGLKHDVELWFAFEDYKLYFLAHESSHWWKNIAKTPRIEVEVSEILFEGTGRIVQDKLDHILELFRRKYGPDQVERWYSGNKKNRAVVIATFGNHFSMNDAIEKFRKEGLQFETEKGHIVKIYLDKNTKERAEQVRSIIREHLGYVEPL